MKTWKDHYKEQKSEKEHPQLTVLALVILVFIGLAFLFISAVLLVAYHFQLITF